MCLAIPGKVIELSSADEIVVIGRVDFSGIVKEINLSFVPEVEVGQYVLTHVGFAISILDENAAKQSLHTLYELSESANEIPR